MSDWIIRNTGANIDAMSKQFKISKILATALANRDILTKRKIQTYLYLDDVLMYNPLDMKDIEEAFRKIIESVAENNLLCIYGDYDVDGVTSTVILYKGLKKYGANVIYCIPDREKDGYGLSEKTIEYMKEQGVDLIITCDNGITNVREVDYINENGMEVIIIDHHEPICVDIEEEKVDVIPNAYAVINPKQKKCPYKFKMLSAGGISYKFIEAFYKYIEVDEKMDEYIVFASISTVCDIVDLIDENRMIVKKGLSILNKNKKINKGLYKLLELNGMEGKKITETDYGFTIGPCINASGRLEKATTAVKLFLEDNDDIINELGIDIINRNEKRKELTAKAYDDVIKSIENYNGINNDILVIYNENIHESIAGIVAGRIKEKYYKPTIIITKSIDGAKGSGRSVPAYNMFEGLCKCDDMFKKYGGHKMAAGLSIDIEKIDEFRERINKNSTLTKKDLTEKIVIDKALEFDKINIDLAEELFKMHPFGKENKEAIFATKGALIKRVYFLGKEKKIVKMLLSNRKIDVYGITFSLYDKFIALLEEKYNNEEIEKIISGNKKDIDLMCDVVYSIEVNTFNGYKNVLLKIRDFRLG